MSRPCEWSSRRSECVVLRRLLQPGSFAPHVHVFGPPNTGKTQLVLDVLRLQRCSFAFVDGLTVTSQRAALAAIAAQLSGGQQSQPQPQSASELAVRLRSLPSLLSRTAFIVVKEAAAVAALSGSSNSEDEWLPALLSLPAVCQRHIAVVLIDRGGSGAAAAAVEGCVPVHFSAYSSEQLTAIIGRSLSVPRLAEEESGGVGKEAGDAALLRFVSDAVNTFIGFSRDLRELHRIVSLLLLQSRSQSQSSGGAMEYMLHAMRREVRQVAANAVFRFDYSAAAVEAAPAAGGGLSRHLSLAQYYLLFASYIASHNSTQDDTRVFASEAIKRKTRRELSMSTRKGATRELPARLLPPKPFELERMMAIYYYIYRSSETSYTNQSQLSLAKPEAAAYQPYTQFLTLVPLQLVEWVVREKRNAGTTDLDCLLFRCCLTYNEICALSNEHKFDLHLYLASTREDQTR